MAALVVAVVAVLSACGSGGPAARSAGATPTVTGAGSSAPPATAPATTPTLPTTTTTLAPPTAIPGWTAVRTTSSAVTVQKRVVTEADGSAITLSLFKAGTFRLDLHDGSTDPPSGGVTLPADGASVVSAAERPLLVGAFNGGFKVSTGSGGAEIDGHVLDPLQTGRASIVIDAAGRPQIGVYGQTVPAAGDPPVSVRQNLGLLVADGKLPAGIGDVQSWGATIGGRSAVARSAVGQDAAGDLIVAASMSALPVDVATALIDVGVTTAMELDINPEWVQLDLSSTPGGPLVAAVAGQNRPAAQFLDGWTRDFFTVLATS